jgi:hypothetical protein
MNTWKLATIRMDQAEKTAIESQYIQQALAARKVAQRASKHEFLSKIRALKALALRFGESFYCRTLGFIYSKPD